MKRGRIGGRDKGEEGRERRDGLRDGSIRLTSTAQMEHPLISTSSAQPWGKWTPSCNLVISSLE